MKRILLTDRNVSLTKAWDKAFLGDRPVLDPEIRIQAGMLGAVLPRAGAEAFITAGNSFGVMDGGIDLVVRRMMPGVQERVIDAIHQRGNILPVGDALVVQSEQDWCPHLIYAPTMFVPEQVHGIEAFLAFHAALAAAERAGIESVAVCGLATATGGFSYEVCAAQMRLAVDFFSMPPLPGKDDDGIHIRGGYVFDQTRWSNATHRYGQLKQVRPLDFKEGTKA